MKFGITLSESMVNSLQKRRKNKTPPCITIIGDTYFDGKKGFFSVWVFKYFLALVLTFGLSFSVVQYYALPASGFFTALFSFLFTSVFFGLLVKVKPSFLLFGTGLIAVLVLGFGYSESASNLRFFADHILYYLDSRLLDTAKNAFYSAKSLSQYNEDYMWAIHIVLVFLIALFALTSVLCSFGKIRPLPIIITALLIYAPTVAAEKAILMPSIIPLAAGLAAMLYIAVSYNFTIKSNAKSLPRTLRDKSYHRKRLAYYGKFSSGAAVTAVITSVVLSLAVLLTTTQFRFDYTSLYEGISSLMSDFTKNGFFTGFDVPLNGYFSSAYGGLDSETLSIKAPPQSDREILKITLSDNKDAKYFRGDIGVDFVNKDGEYVWTTVSKNDDSDYGQMLESYVPETKLKLFYELLLARDKNPDKIIGIDTALIEYLFNSDIVMLPTVLDDYTLREDENFTVEGDTVIRSKDKHISSISASMLYPKGDYKSFSKLIDGFWESSEQEWSEDYFEAVLSQFYSASRAEEIISYAGGYTEYVNQTYLYVPDEYKGFLDKFIDEFPSVFNPSIDRFIVVSDGSIFELDGGYEDKRAYAVAEELADIFKANYVYSLNPEEPPEGVNPIDHFLNDTKAGHCALYATSMTLLLREAGIPARYCTGVVTGGDGKAVDGNYEYTLKASNFHAWVEIYLESAGWVPFDPTSAQTGGNTALTSASSTAATTPAMTTLPPSTTTASHAATTSAAAETENPAESTSETSSVIADIETTAYFIAGAVVLAVLLVLIGLALFGLRKEQRILSKLNNLGGKNGVRRMYALIMKLLAIGGISPEENELPTAFALRADEALFSPKFEASLSKVMMILQEAEFGKNEISAEESALAAEYARLLYDEIVRRKNPFTRFARRLLV